MCTSDLQRPAEVVRNQLIDLGLDVQIEQLQQAAWNERWLADDYDWILNGSVVDADPDDGHWNFFHSDGPWNTLQVQQPRGRRAAPGALAPPAIRRSGPDLFQEIQAILQQDVADAFLYHTLDITGFSNDVQGYDADPGDALPGDGLARSVRRSGRRLDGRRSRLVVM